MNNYQKRLLGSAIAFLLLCAATARADQAATWAPNKSNPYRALFQPKVVVPSIPSTLPPAPAKAVKPTVKCGLTMIPGDSKIDPGMAKKMEKPATRFPMRAIEPPICR